MQSKVWVVTKGEYSDYGIVRIFSNKEKAEQYAETFSRTRYHENASVEEWPLDSDFDRERIFWDVTFWAGGYGGTEGHTADREEELPKDAVVNQVVDDVKKCRWDKPGYQQCSVWVQTDTEEKALKIGSDLVAQFLAEQAGIA